MLKNFLPNKIIKKSIFEVNLICFEPKKKKKDIDFLFYYRIHSNKSNYYLLNLINKLADQKKKNFYCWRLFP